MLYKLKTNLVNQHVQHMVNNHVIEPLNIQTSALSIYYLFIPSLECG